MGEFKLCPKGTFLIAAWVVERHAQQLGNNSPTGVELTECRHHSPQLAGFTMSFIPFDYKTRRYLHFDAPIGRNAATAVVTSPRQVSGHGFFPFITQTLWTQKVRKRQGGGVEFKDPKDREIMYAGHMDSHIFSYYAQLLVSPYEGSLKECGLTNAVTAFRKVRKEHSGRMTSWKNTHFANEAFNFIKSTGPCAVLAMDFSKFFNNLDHRILKEAWAALLNVQQLPDDHYAVFKAITKYAKVEKSALYVALEIDEKHPRRGGRVRLCSSRQFREQIRGGSLCSVNREGKGIPQGSPISALLSNIYMLEFDRAIHDFITTRGGMYRRYCDDILLVMPTIELRQEAEDLILRWCADLRLPVNPEKTERIEFALVNGHLTTRKPLQYLGFTFDGRNKRIRPASVAKYYKKMRKGVGRAKAVRFRADRDNGRPYTTWLRRKKLYLHYSYLGRHNFLAYAFEASRIMSDVGIKKQVKRHWKRLQESIGEPRTAAEM